MQIFGATSVNHAEKTKVNRSKSTHLLSESESRLQQTQKISKSANWELVSAPAGDEPQPSSFPKRFDCRSPFLFFVLILFLLLSAPLSAWPEEPSEIALPDDERALLKANPKKEAKPEPVTIQLRWFHQFQFAGYYAAIEKGFYAEEGLDVSLLEFNPKEGRVAPVLAGRLGWTSFTPP